MTRSPHHNNNTKRTWEYLKRDIPSVEFEEFGGERKKVALIDKTRKHREIAYLSKSSNIIEAMNTLALSYMAKFSSEMDIMRLATSNGKVN